MLANKVITETASMLDILEVVRHASEEEVRHFQSKIKSINPAECHFLMGYAPLFEKGFQEVCAFLKNQPILVALLSDETLTNTLINHLIHLWLPFISRIYVYEMHVLKNKNQLKGDTPEERFKSFIALVQTKENTLAILNKYGQLKNLIQVTYDQYLKTFIELLTRLSQDFAEIRELFLTGEKDDWQLTQIEMSGDKHKQGRSVALLRFKKSNADNSLAKTVVYKPRSLAIDIAFQNILAWFNARCKGPALYTLRTINKFHYGWCEFIEYDRCQNEAEINDFYQRMGKLLCIANMLGASDIHAENMIAHGAHPVIIDLECMLRPYFQDDVVSDTAQGTTRHLVTDSLLLPCKIMSKEDYNGLDLSGIGGRGGDETPYRLMQWEKSGTDEMHLVRNKGNFPAAKNTPQRADGECVQAALYEQAIVAGFNECYQVLLAHQSMLVNPQTSPLQAFANSEVRLVLRATNIYAKLMIESYHPILLHNEKEYQRHFAWLKENAPTQYSFYADLLPSEYRDLMTNNIPYFYFHADGKTIFDSYGNAVNIALHHTGLEKAYTYLQNQLSTEDLALQCVLIQNSFTALRMNEGQLSHSVQTLKSHDFKALQDSYECRDHFSYQEKALQIAKRELHKLLKYKIDYGHKTFWPVVEMVGIDAWTPQLTNLDLYNGVAGIGITFAYAAEIFQDVQYRHIAQQCFNTIISSINTHGSKCIKGAGAFEGLGGILYALAIDMLFYSRHETQETIAKLFTFADEIINADEKFDMVGGVAGLIVCLASIQQVLPQTNAHIVLKTAYQHFIKNFKAEERFHISEKENTPQTLLGFSHGAAGYAFALTKALPYLNDEEQASAINIIKLALTYERFYFNTECNNWPHYDFTTKNNYHQNTNRNTYAWCHGAPGIGMARMDMQTDWQDALIDAEIMMALQQTLQNGLQPLTNLCHGCIGNIELLLMAQTNKVQYTNVQEFDQIATNFIQHFHRNGTHFQVDGTFALPGLMMGSAGVAYQMMRIARPHQVPSVLLLKLPKSKP